MNSKINIKIQKDNNLQTVSKTFDVTEGAEWLKHFKTRSIDSIEIENLKDFSYSQMVRTARNAIAFLKPSGYWRINLSKGNLIERITKNSSNSQRNKILLNKDLLIEFLMENDFIPNFDQERQRYVDAVKPTECKL
ncbi:MAG: hypothetical protein ACR2J3_01345 [Aridibacter sp.]